MSAGRSRRVGAALMVAVAVTALPACEVQVTGPSVVLRIATADLETEDAAAPIKQFATEVDRRSGGTIRIEPVWDVPKEGTSHWDQETARAVVDGTYEMGLVPGRAWDELGVDSLRALNAPFLIASHAALASVLNSSVREELLSGLRSAGVVGIDIFPDALRHPFGYNSPLLDVGDYEGLFINAAQSRTVARLFWELGADAADQESAIASFDGAEAQFSRAPAGVQYGTGNVTFFPKTNVLVAGADVRKRLRPDQWAVIREAAVATREWQFSQQPSDFEAAAGFCDRGGVIVGADDGQLDDLEEVGDRVTTWLDRDPRTRDLIEEIARLIADVPPEEPITECPGTSEDDPGTELDGVYRARVRKSDLIHAGVTNEVQVKENSGRWTWTLDSGTFTFHTESSRYLNNPDDSGRFTYDGTELVIYWQEETDDHTTLDVRVTRRGDLHFSNVRENLPENQALGEGMFAIPWRRVGDLPD